MNAPLMRRRAQVLLAIAALALCSLALADGRSSLTLRASATRIDAAEAQRLGLQVRAATHLGGPGQLAELTSQHTPHAGSTPGATTGAASRGAAVEPSTAGAQTTAPARSDQSRVRARQRERVRAGQPAPAAQAPTAADRPAATPPAGATPATTPAGKPFSIMEDLLQSADGLAKKRPAPSRVGTAGAGPGAGAAGAAPSTAAKQAGGGDDRLHALPGDSSKSATSKQGSAPRPGAARPSAPGTGVGSPGRTGGAGGAGRGGTRK